jgi:hypothetical protein
MKTNSILVVVIVLTIAILSFGTTATAKTPTNAQLQTQLQTLVQQLQQLQKLRTTQTQQQSATTQAWCHTFVGYLVAGSSDVATNGEVSFLQTALTKSGFDASVDGFGTFGDATAAAVVQFQGKNKITQTGTVGPKTRAQLNSLYGCAPGQTPAQSVVVTPQVQTPSIVAPNNSNFCNGIYYTQCSAGGSFVCPTNGSTAYCQIQQNQLIQYQQQQCTNGNCVLPATPQYLQQQQQCTGGNCTLPATPQNQSSQSVPASCNGHIPTDLNLPADCAAFNASHGVIPPSECMGKRPTDSNLSQSCINWFSMFSMPQSNQPNQSQIQGSPQQNGMPPPPECVDKTATTANLPQSCQIYFGLIPQPYQSQPNQSTQQPPASCNGHMPTDLNLPADCAAWNAAHPMPMMNQTTCAQGGGTWNSATNFCAFPNMQNQPGQPSQSNNPSSMNISQENLASVLMAFKNIVQEFQSLIAQ